MKVKDPVLDNQLNQFNNELNHYDDDMSTIETITAKPTTYHISGPGMATVIRTSAPVNRRNQAYGIHGRGGGMKNISPSMLRVHFPFAPKDQDKFAFDMGPLHGNSLRQSGTFTRGNSFTGKKF